MKECTLSILLAISCGVGRCQSRLEVQALDGNLFKGKAFVKPGSPSAGAAFCLDVNVKRLCHQMPPRRLGNELPAQQFGLDPSFEAIGRSDARSVAKVILFKADAEPFLSRRDTRVMLFVLTAGPQLRTVLTDVTLSEQREYLAWIDTSLSPMPILTTADYTMNAAGGETHFGKHHYSVVSYVWNPSSVYYERVDSFTTSSRYPGFDEVQKIQVISREMAAIKDHLRDVLAKPR